MSSSLILNLSDTTAPPVDQSSMCEVGWGDRDNRDEHLLKRELQENIIPAITTGESTSQECQRTRQAFQITMDAERCFSYFSTACLPLAKISSITIGFLLMLGTMNMVCFSHLKFTPRLQEVNEISDLSIKDSPSNFVCKPLYGAFVGFSPDNNRESIYGLLLQGFVLPLSFASVLAAIHVSILWEKKSRRSGNHIEKLGGRVTSSSNRDHTNSSSILKRDPPLTFLAIIFVVIPSLYMSFEPLLYPFQEELKGLDFWYSVYARSANPAGVAACFALSLFLIPVAKHSPLIEVFGLSFTQAIFFHRISGWMSLVFSLIHGGFFVLQYGLRDDAHGFWANALPALYPPGHCWGWDILSSNGLTETKCYGYWRNFTGVTSILAFLILAVTSFPVVRRKAYWLFISVHIPAAWIMMLGAIAHFHFIALLLLPNILYYLVMTVPVWLKQFANACLDGGTNVKSITWIADSKGCCLIRLRRPANDDFLLDDYYGGVCKICVPEISSIWHPFSVTLDPCNEDHICLLVRPVGHFTKAFLHGLLSYDVPVGEDLFLTSSSDNENLTHQDTSTPTIRPTKLNSVPRKVLVDGVYPAEYRWHRNILHQHDSVLLLAGGVGIVPFLTFLPQMIGDIVSNSNDICTKSPLNYLGLHWYCREEGLAKFVCKQFQLAQMFDASTTTTENTSSSSSCCGFQQEQDGSPRKIVLQLFVHITSRQPGNHDMSDFENAIRGPHINTSVNDNIIIDTHTDYGAMGFLRSNQQQESEVTSQQFDDLYTSNTTFTFKYNPGIQSWAINVKTWQSLLIFTLSIVTSVTIHWIFHPNHHSTIPRAYPVLFGLLIALFFGMLLFLLERNKFCNKKSHSGFESVLEHDNSGEEDGIVVENAPTGELSMTHEQSNSVIILRNLAISAGRPQMEGVIGPLINAKNPGAFFCGPETLRSRVKASITKKRQEEHGFSARLSCAFYDEHSDI